MLSVFQSLSSFRVLRLPYCPTGLLSKTRRVLRKEPLLLAMLVAVVVGVVGGSLARFLQPSAREVELLGKACDSQPCAPALPSISNLLASCYPCEGLLGELMIRSLKMLVLPLVAGCMVASVCALGEAGSGMGRTAAWTLGIFFATTCIAAMLGVILAATFHPGHNGDLSSQGMPTGIHTARYLCFLVLAAPQLYIMQQYMKFMHAPHDICQ